MKKWIAITVVLFASIHLNASIVDSSSFFSPSMQKTIKYIVVLPSNYQSEKARGVRYPVMYMLHCAGIAGGSARGWIERYNSTIEAPEVDELIDSVRFIAAGISDETHYGWWLDSPIKPSSKYSTALRIEFKKRIDSLYATYTNPANTGLTGFSMGGFGTFRHLLFHPDIFGVGFAVCGATNLLRWPDTQWHLNEILGNKDSHPGNWQAVNVLSNASRFVGSSVKLQFYVGSSDALFSLENQQLHDKLDSLHFPHTYYVNQGTAHDYPTKSKMLQIMKYFDSAFAYGQVSPILWNGKKPLGPNLSLESTNGPNAFPVVYNLIGQKMSQAKNIYSGIYYPNSNLSNKPQYIFVLR